MRNLRKQDDYWKPCRPGTILGVSDSKFRRQRRRFLVQAAMGSVVGLTGLFSAMFIIAHRKKNSLIADSAELTDPSLAGTDDEILRQKKGSPVIFTCEDIAHQLDNYVLAMNRSDEELTLMQRDLMVEFDRHLMECKDCRQLVTEALKNV